jgi:hypothetical protein
MTKTRPLAIGLALCMVTVRLAPTASASVPDYDTSCEEQLAFDQLDSTRTFLEESDAEGYADETEDNVFFGYVVCKFFPL